MLLQLFLVTLTRAAHGFFLPHSTRPCTCFSQLKRPSSPLDCHAQTTLHVSVKEANGRENGDESNYKNINVESDYHL